MRDKGSRYKKKLSVMDSQQIQDKLKNPISDDLQTNMHYLQQAFANSSDIVFRKVTAKGEISLLVVYVDGMVDANAFDQNVLRPLLYEGLPQGIEKVKTIAEACEKEYFSVLHTKTVSKYGDLIESILKANIAILVEKEDKALIADLKKFEKRPVSEPTIESTVRGPREAFTETLRVNTSLIRRRIPSHKLKIESIQVGQMTQTDAVIVYMDGIVMEPVLAEVKKRMDKIMNIKGVIESNYIEEYLEQDSFSPFPQVQNTERPDTVTASVMEGKVAILTDGAPSALIVPMTFWVGLQAADDYYERSIFVNGKRLTRFLFAIAAILFPALFVALVTFHPGMIPRFLMISIAAARENSPFPTAIETLVMEFLFEGLQEAGLRLPRPIGPLVSIVGGLVIGQAAVTAGIISAPIVIVVAATGIASYSIPRYSFGFAFRLLRFILVLLAASFGLYGIAVGVMAILIHLVNLQSLGTPYLSPVAPRIRSQLKDMLIRVPRWMATSRRSN